MNVQYVNAKTARARLGVSSGTLRRWANDGTVKTIRTPGNFRLYAIGPIFEPGEQIVANDTTGSTGGRQRIVYCRVSSTKQRDDLQRQIDRMRELFPTHNVVSDVGSGLNFRRKGLRSILELASRGLVEEVVVAHRDRLCRFAFELVEWVLSRHGAKLVVLDQEVASSPEGELVADLLAIVNVFTCRINGKRRYTKRRPRDAGARNNDAAPSGDDEVPEGAGREADDRVEEEGDDEGDEGIDVVV